MKRPESPYPPSSSPRETREGYLSLNSARLHFLNGEDWRVLGSRGVPARVGFGTKAVRMNVLYVMEPGTGRVYSGKAVCPYLGVTLRQYLSHSLPAWLRKELEAARPRR